MRTDVKIGLIAVFVILISLVAYFAWQGKKTETPPLPTVGSPLTGTDSGTADGSVRIVPPTPASLPAATEPTTLTGSWPTTGPATTGPAWGPLVTTTRPDTALPRSPWDRDTGSTTRPAWETTPIPGPTLTTTRPAWDTAPLTTDTTVTGSATHTVVAGDTFGKLAKQYHTTIKAIAAANPGVDSAHLKLRQKINTPATTGTTDTHTTTTRTPPDTTTPPATTTRPAAAPGGKYTVQKGDTLTKIAIKVYGSKKYAARIARANRTRLQGDPNSIEVGQVLVLPTK